MTRNSFSAVPWLCFLMASCGGDDEAKPRTFQETCAQFCEKFVGAMCTGVSADFACLERCLEQANDYPDCVDEMKEGLDCFLRADVECMEGPVDLTFPHAVGNACDRADNAVDACKQSSTPGAGDAGTTGP